MARFTKETRPQGTVLSPETRGTTRTYEGAVADVREPKAELFLLAVTNLVGQESFYENARRRDDRFAGLVHRVSVEDPEWFVGFVGWLRGSANMRTAAVVAAAEHCLAGGTAKRRAINAALQRGDEPAEFLGYWIQRTGRHTLPGGVQRGLRDAVERLYTERAALRYDSQKANVRMGDVVELVKPRSRDQRQKELFDYLYDNRRNRPVPGSQLGVIATRRELEELPSDRRREAARHPEWLRAAAVSWEWLAGWLPGGMDAEAWELAIPEMGYMATLRNLRNFDEAGVSKESLRRVEDYLTDPEAVRQSKQLPIRFLSAWKAVSTTRWGPVLEEALEETFANVPRLSGRTLVLVDMSASMRDPLSAKSQVQRWEAGLLFGHAAARASDSADLFVYSGRGWLGRGHGEEEIYHRLDPKRSPLRMYDDATAWRRAFGGTQTWATVRGTLDLTRHDRLVLVTDEQAHDSYRENEKLPERTYVVNVAGYRPAQVPKQAVVFGGLSDAAFTGLSAIESRHDQRWPWEQR